MLSLSADLSNANVDLQMINGDESAVQGDVAHASALMRFAEAIARRDEPDLAQAREDLLRSAGAEVLVDAAAVAANFQRMVRIADCTGIPLDNISAAMSVGIRKQLNLQRFSSARNTPVATIKQKMLGFVAMPLAKWILGRRKSK